MSVYKSAILIWTTVDLVSHLLAGNPGDCGKKCGEVKGYYGSMRNGSMICFYNPTFQGAPSGHTECYIDCMEYKKPDQTKCWCDTCKENEQQFCDKPYGKPLQEEECNTVVCSGKMGSSGVRYRGKWCSGSKKAKKLDQKYGFE